ncbi:hypothetical protein, partial [Paracoccus chinensis]|uniref:hypothetical protein n=1 Tax=Paracoccus chinensis TaxID=525640 RepID=UPI001C31B2FC
MLMNGGLVEAFYRFGIEALPARFEGPGFRGDRGPCVPDPTEVFCEKPMTEVDTLPQPPKRPSHALACCRFRGHEDKIVTKGLEITHDETEVQPRVQ